MKIKIEFYKKGKDVLLIFTGLGGSAKGYENKYERIARQVMNEHGFSVAVVATPQYAWECMEEILQYAMDFLDTKADDYKVYAMGTSAGANILLENARFFPQIKKLLAVNPVLDVDSDWICGGIENFAGEVFVVSGDMDPSCDWLWLFSHFDNVQTTVLPDTDHVFMGKMQSFLDLPNIYLFGDEGTPRPE